MRAKHGTFPVIVQKIEQVTPLIRVFRFVDADGDLLPGFSGGSHIIVLIRDGERVHRNPYSLISSPFDTRFYEIAVGLEQAGRGGSRAMHALVREGDRLEISYPANQFPLDTLAKKHVLIGGGVGVTPLLAHLSELELGSTPFEMHYGVRSLSHGGLASRISPRVARFVRVYCEDTDGRIEFTSVFSNQPLGTHVYVCGPKAMLEAALSAAHSCGWPDSHIHFELFEQQTSGEPFEVVFTRSGKTVYVPPELSLLEAAEAAGVAIPYLCRGGACGHCETEIVSFDGELIHRDIWLSDSDKRKGKKFMPCVSRARCSKLALNA
jgi:dimethylamine monooxygenase subunit B